MKKIIKHLKENRNYFYVAAALFFISLILGTFQIVFNDYFKGAVDDYKDVELSSDSSVIFEIFLNNILIDALGFMLGIVFIAPIFILLFNGYFIGYFLTYLIRDEGLPYLSLLFLLPHGIFELSSFFIACGLGIALGFKTFIPGYNSKEELLKEFWISLKTFLLVVVPLTFLAAAIEGLLIMYMSLIQNYLNNVYL